MLSGLKKSFFIGNYCKLHWRGGCFVFCAASRGFSKAYISAKKDQPIGQHFKLEEDTLILWCLLTVPSRSPTKGSSTLKKLHNRRFCKPVCTRQTPCSKQTWFTCELPTNLNHVLNLDTTLNATTTSDTPTCSAQRYCFGWPLGFWTHPFLSRCPLVQGCNGPDLHQQNVRPLQNHWTWFLQVGPLPTPPRSGPSPEDYWLPAHHPASSLPTSSFSPSSPFPFFRIYTR